MSKRAAAVWFSLGCSVLLLLAAYCVWAVTHKDGASPSSAEERKVRDAILKLAGSRSGEVKFYKFEDATKEEVNEQGKRLGAKAVYVSFRGPSLVTQDNKVVGDFMDWEAVFMVIGDEVVMRDKKPKRP